MPPVVHQLLVTLVEENGQKTVNVQGPIRDKILCYGMLEGAKDAVRDYRPPLVQPAGPDEMELLRSRNAKKPGEP